MSEQNNSAAKDTERTDIIAGRNPVTEALRSGKEIDKILVAKGISGGSITAITAKCRQKGIVIKEVPQTKLDFICGGANHQGVAAFIAARAYSTVEEILDFAKSRGEQPFLVVCDDLEDPHNLGAIIRTAEACGVHGIITPKRRAATLNATVAKAASGALEYMRVAKVTNISDTLCQLKENNIWIYGADMDGETWCETNFDGGVALVIGNEGKGISRLVSEKCDKIVSLPMTGEINSLNASVAAGVLMYEVLRQRKKIKAF